MSPPHSPLYVCRETPNAGRGMFAVQQIPAGTEMLVTGPPDAHTIYQAYRREVCCNCFKYDRGVNWKVKLPDLGLVFCSSTCQDLYLAKCTDEVLDARRSVQKLLMRRSRPEDYELEGGDEQLGVEEVEQAWKEVASLAECVKRARGLQDIVTPIAASKTTSMDPVRALSPDSAQRANARVKSSKREDQKTLLYAQSLPLDPGTVWFLFSALMTFASSYKQPQSEVSTTTREPTSTPAWSMLLNLGEDASPYPSKADLISHRTAFLALVAVLPAHFSSVLTTSLVRTAQSRASHNVFGIRSLGEGLEEEPGSEILGFGLWSIASYWNHACSPNLRKQRHGCRWRFWTARDVNIGEELCISYLGGDEKDMTVEERREKLNSWWGFDCQCQTCLREAASGEVAKQVQT